MPPRKSIIALLISMIMSIYFDNTLAQVVERNPDCLTYEVPVRLNEKTVDTNTSGTTPLKITASKKPVSSNLQSNMNRTQERGDQVVAGAGSELPGAKCTCVPYYLCNKGTDLRTQSQCENVLDVCCVWASRVEEPTTTTTTPAPPRPMERTGCGYRNPDGVGFRVPGLDFGSSSTYGEFPWTVAIVGVETIQGNPKRFNVYQCGGSLIHPQVVLTAAHCVTDKNKRFKIRAGEWDLQARQHLLWPQQQREIEKVQLHPRYYAGGLHNDVALLFLDSPVTVLANIGVVCLPGQDQVIDDNAKCFASGWGKDVSDKDGGYAGIMKKVQLPIVQRSPCQEALRKTKLGKSFELHTSFICAGGEKGKDTCKGDGGSPLVCPIEGQKERYIQTGIVAWGVGCGNVSTPGVYANVASFRDWIDEQMILNNFDPASYQFGNAGLESVYIRNVAMHDPQTIVNAGKYQPVLKQES